MIIQTKNGNTDVYINNNKIIIDFYGNNNARIIIDKHDATELAGTLLVLAEKITHDQLGS